MDSIKKILDDYKFSLTVFSVIVVSIIFAEYITYYNTYGKRFDYFSFFIGLVGCFGIYMHAQKIIIDNSFKQFSIFGFAIFIASLLKQFLAGFYLIPLFVSGIPLLFVVYFRFLTSLFYKGYPNSAVKPIIIFASSRGLIHFKGKYEGYKPSLRERTFSLLLFLGFTFLVSSILLILRLTFR